MWAKQYRDYKTDEKNIKQAVEPGQGLTQGGCEMHEIYGWGNTLQHPQKKKRGMIAAFLAILFNSKEKRS